MKTTDTTTKHGRRTKKIESNVEAEPWYIAEQVVKANKVTMRELAERMNFSVSSVHRLLHRMPNIVHVKLLADALGVRFMDLFDLELLEREYNGNKSQAEQNNTGSAAEASGPTFLRLTGTVDATYIRCPACHKTLALMKIPDFSSE